MASDRGYCEDGQTEAAEGGGEDGRGQVKVAEPVMTSSTRFTVEQQVSVQLEPHPGASHNQGKTAQLGRNKIFA